MGLLSVCQYAICMLGAGSIRGQERALKVRSWNVGALEGQPGPLIAELSPQSFTAYFM